MHDSTMPVPGCPRKQSVPLTFTVTTPAWIATEVYHRAPTIQGSLANIEDKHGPKLGANDLCHALDKVPIKHGPHRWAVGEIGRAYHRAILTHATASTIDRMEAIRPPIVSRDPQGGKRLHMIAVPTETSSCHQIWLITIVNSRDEVEDSLMYTGGSE